MFYLREIHRYVLPFQKKRVKGYILKKNESVLNFKKNFLWGNNTWISAPFLWIWENIEKRLNLFSNTFETTKKSFGHEIHSAWYGISIVSIHREKMRSIPRALE
ncbi:MAG: hypothetical protein A3B10_00860 [Candidatus Doudnabacteria bacterium RIFCSPLOWO2_01_FULL_44_21]|uniref:Uncharacterized protein n=1 Tax=Candidatus Doudnabacteria bacterium RIFCSPLOWO2_01_FULL_44_21 TaxID=1817841 RepID=A0A1F5PX87_9BACT|nr:MAG: hypothetical protein A3B10_00860 [Candidatus Doudnabacteria bacterium RIFCSPLOWO2_01_FULL_44_21]